MTRKRVPIAIAILLLLSSATAGLNAQGPREGIVVRGHWVLEVRNPDGSMSDRREFENALAGGEYLLTDLLAHSATMGTWTIRLIPVGGGASLYIDDPLANPPSFGKSFPTLSVSRTNFFGEVVPPGTRNGAQLVLTGTATAADPVMILAVSTDTGACPESVAAAACNAGHAGGGYNFSQSSVKNSAGVPTPLSLVKNQSVHVTVTISFTSAPH